MVVVEACKIGLPQSPSLSSAQVSSLLFDPHSLSLALMHADSSFSLYPFLSPFSLSTHSLPPPQTLVPCPSSSAAFVRLQSSNPNSTPHSVFVAAGPHRGGAAVRLSFWILQDSQSFARAKVICNQKELTFDGGKSGVVFEVNHGVSIKLVGSINVFAMYSVSNAKIWVFAVKIVGDGDDGVTLKLMKCAVIDCSLPVFTISVSFGYLILGEENGVRVFHLRPLVEGRGRKQRREGKNSNVGLNNDKVESQRLNLPNGLIHTANGTDFLGPNSMRPSKQLSANGYLEGKAGKNCDHVKPRMVKLRQESKEAYVSFVALQSKELESYKLKKTVFYSAKAVSVQALSSNKLLVLDSAGDLHLLCLPVLGSEIACYVKPICYSMKVKNLAALPELSTGTHAFWISDGHNTVHMIAVDSDISANESEAKESEEREVQVSATQVIFSSEGIQDVVPLATNAILVLGQGNIFAYAIS